MKLYVKIGTLAVGSGYGYLYFVCKRRREDLINEDLIAARKDSTRPSNVYYGINWGYRADETIEKALDTGDILFFGYDCSKCLTPEEVLVCYKQKYLRGEEDP